MQRNVTDTPPPPVLSPPFLHRDALQTADFTSYVSLSSQSGTVGCSRTNQVTGTQVQSRGHTVSYVGLATVSFPPDAINACVSIGAQSLTQGVKTFYVIVLDECASDANGFAASDSSTCFSRGPNCGWCSSGNVATCGLVSNPSSPYATALGGTCSVAIATSSNGVSPSPASPSSQPRPSPAPYHPPTVTQTVVIPVGIIVSVSIAVVCGLIGLAVRCSQRFRKSAPARGAVLNRLTTVAVGHDASQARQLQPHPSWQRTQAMQAMRASPAIELAYNPANMAALSVLPRPPPVAPTAVAAAWPPPPPLPPPPPPPLPQTQPPATLAAAPPSL